MGKEYMTSPFKKEIVVKESTEEFVVDRATEDHKAGAKCTRTTKQRMANHDQRSQRKVEAKQSARFRRMTSRAHWTLVQAEVVTLRHCKSSI